MLIQVMVQAGFRILDARTLVVWLWDMKVTRAKGSDRPVLSAAIRPRAWYMWHLSWNECCSKDGNQTTLFPFPVPLPDISCNESTQRRLPHLHWSDSLEGCWRCCSLYWERILQLGCPACGWNQKLFQTTKTHPVLLGLTNLHPSSLEATHVYRMFF